MPSVAVFGATSAIAEAVARRFVSADTHFFLVARNPEHLHSIATDLRVRGAKVETGIADLADLAALPEQVAAAKRALGRIDFALIAHGTLPDQRACEADVALASRQITINFISQATLLGLLGNVLAEQRGGTVAVVGSVAGDRGRQSNYVYGSAKAAIATFTAGLRHRLAPLGAHAVLIKPGFVDTPMTDGLKKGGPLWATPDRVAADIVAAMRSGRAVCYTPWFWSPIMRIIRAVPDRIFNRTQL
jgi:short-subunit dehydrogenase